MAFPLESQIRVGGSGVVLGTCMSMNYEEDRKENTRKSLSQGSGVDDAEVKGSHNGVHVVG